METAEPRWRVLETSGTDGRDEPADAGPRSDGSPGQPRMGLGFALVGGGAVALGVVAIAIVLLGPTPVASVAAGGSEAEVRPAAAVTPASSSPGEGALVDVGGAVVRPGLYRLDPGARVGDAIAAAGGFGPRVDVHRAEAELNLAEKVSDGDRIRVPSRDDPGTGGPSATAGAASANAPGALVDLNRATASELDALPGIGPVTAAKIVDGREKERYASVDDLLARKIVGRAALAKFRDLVTVR